MPIIIKKYDWKETESVLFIRVPLQGVHQSKVDIFYAKLYLKASFEQYFFEIFLLNEIDLKQSNCTITSTEIVFNLTKLEPKLWGTLEKCIEKSKKQELKKFYIEEELQRQKEENQSKKDQKAELKRLAVREQIALDTIQRKSIENKKNAEKTQALSEMALPTRGKKTRKHHPPKHNETKPTTITPLPRSHSTVIVDFTHRDFPTPVRESRLEEEAQWLRQQATARRSAGFISEDIRPEERNPQFLLAKGDDFAKNGNYMGAISAYSFGIQISNKCPDLYIARSRAHFRLENWNKTAQDCSQAMELLKPEVEANLDERAFCVGRRGAALVKLGLIKEGIGELKASLRLKRNSEFEEELRLAENML